MKINHAGRTARIAFAAIFSLITAVMATSGDAIAQDAQPTTPFGQMASKLNPANWTMPNFRGLLPGQDETTRIKTRKEGLVTEVKQSASNSWKKTKEVFNPQKLNPANYFSTASTRIDEEPVGEPKPGFFSSLFMPKEPVQEKTSTVQDFLKQERP